MGFTTTVAIVAVLLEKNINALSFMKVMLNSRVIFGSPNYANNYLFPLNAKATKECTIEGMVISSQI